MSRPPPEQGRLGDGSLDGLLPAIAEQLPRMLPVQRWYGDKGRAISRVVISDTAAIPEHPAALLAILDVYTDADAPTRYFLPLGLFPAAEHAPPGQVILTRGDLVVRDAIGDPDTCRALLRGILRGDTLTTAQGGAFAFRAVGRRDLPNGAALADADADASIQALPVRFVGVEQSNTSVIFGERLILKALRRVAVGANPDIEIPGFLGAHTTFDRVPTLIGWAEYRAPDGSSAPVGVLQQFVPNDGDGWAYVLRLAGSLTDGGPDDPAACRLASDIAALGETLAGLHAALASREDIPDFSPEPITSIDLDAWKARTHASLDDVLGRLRRGVPSDTESTGVAADGRAILSGEGRLRAIIDGIDVLTGTGVVKTRHHGDFHLGQTLVTPAGWMILDFEGEPLRPLHERRAKQTPLRDVAGLLRSLDYARATAERRRSVDATTLRAAFTAGRAAMLGAYVSAIAASGVPILPRTDRGRQRALLALELEKALYELVYELGNRPDWTPIPLAAVAALTRSGGEAPSV